jgi:RNA polymerase sigma-70 factor (sigma-E family)
MPTTARMTAAGEPVAAAPDATLRATTAISPSFDELFAEQFPRLVRVAALIVGSTATAEEIVQDAFIKVYRRWDGLDSPAAFARVCVVNGCRDRLRRRARWRVRVPLLVDDPTVTEPVDEGEIEILELVRALPERQRTAIVLRYYEGLTPTEIAEVLGVTPASVKSLLHRAIETFREELDR